MQFKIINLTLILLATLLFLASCNDDEDLSNLTSSEVLSTCPDSVDPFCPLDSICEIFVVVEDMPRFFHEDCENLMGVSKEERNECANEKLAEFIDEHVVYPEAARENNIEGNVIVSFIVRGEFGCLSDIEILRDIGYGCGIEVQRVVATIENYVMGEQRGTPVDVLIRIDYKFEL